MSFLIHGSLQILSNYSQILIHEILFSHFQQLSDSTLSADNIFLFYGPWFFCSINVSTLGSTGKKTTTPTKYSAIQKGCDTKTDNDYNGDDGKETLTAKKRKVCEQLKKHTILHQYVCMCAFVCVCAHNLFGCIFVCVLCQGKISFSRFRRTQIFVL